MAAKAFRQQCPSCEVMVLVPDRAQIGKKIDCPKCKYRFVVEPPTTTAEATDVEVVEVVEDAPAGGAAKPKSGATAAKKPSPAPAAPAKGPPAAKGPPPKKRPAPDRTDFGDDDDEPAGFKAKSKKDGAGNLVLAAGIGVALIALGILGVGGYFMFLTGDDAKPPTKNIVLATQPATKKEITDEPPKTVQLGDISNMLPNDTEGLYHFNCKAILTSMLAAAAFDAPGAFQRRAVEERLGLKLNEVQDLFVAQNFQKGWSFSVLRTSQPINVDKFRSQLGLKAAPDSPINKQDFFVTEPSTWLDNLTRIVTDFYSATSSKAEPLKPRSLAIRIVDEQTLVVADPLPMKEFLEVNGKPALLNDAKGPGRSHRFLTVNERLKKVLDKVEYRTPIMASVAWDMTAFQDTVGKSLNLLVGMKMLDAKALTLLKEMKAVGLSLQLPEDSVFTLAIDGTRPDFGKSVQEEVRAAAQGIARSGYMVTIDNKTLPATPTWTTVGRPQPRFTIRTSPDETPPTFLVTVTQPPPDGNTRLRQDVLEPQMQLLNGMTEMAGSQQNIFDVARAVQADVKKAGAFPRGTADRKGPNLGRLIPPDQRVSWMVDLLPYLGYEEVAKEINVDRTWRPEWDAANQRFIDGNARMGAVLIPAFLDPSSPSRTWWVQMPSMPSRRFAATHFVGIAGVGLDAADYSASDPAQAKKMGIFGYNRQTKPEDIKDGLAHTIFMLQVPGTYRRPWIAGGGATVTGVPETNSIGPFISTKRGTQEGTYALMADGSVRFIGKGIPDNVFKGMCTINGGDKGDIDANSTVIPPGQPKGQPVAGR